MYRRPRTSSALDLAHGRRLREHVLLTLKGLEVDSHAQTVETARALSALSTVLKNTHALARTTLGIYQREESNLPIAELVIKDMTIEEIAEARTDSAVRSSIPGEEVA